MKDLRIDNPCPMLLMRMNKDGDKFSCKSCREEVVDFRGKTHDEIIKAQATGSSCGIYYTEQLPGSPKMSVFRQSVFYALTVLSFLGFNVSPANAVLHTASSGQMEINNAENPPDKDKDKKQKKKKKSRKRRVIMGKMNPYADF